MDLCIYHAPCYDGFTAAWVAHQRYPGAEYLGAGYGDEAPDVTGRDVVIVDFSYPRDVLERMHAQAASLLVLDHHKSAEAALEGLPYARFSKHRSGAGMAWEHFMAGAPMPALVQYVEDRDLWLFALPSSKDINAWIMSHDYDFATWTDLNNALKDTSGLMIATGAGRALQRKHALDCKRLIEATKRTMVIGGHTVPVVNASFLHASEIGHMLAEPHDVPFAAIYHDATTARRFSLRSDQDGGADVSEIAKMYGGGGHKNAAGFEMPIGWEGDDELSPVAEVTPAAKPTKRKRT